MMVIKSLIEFQINFPHPHFFYLIFLCLFHAGEYFVVGMDVEQYDSSNPEKYLMGLLHSEQESWVGHAYQSYLAVLPSPLVGFDDFAKKV